jgi:hypothetical protein
MCTLSFLPATNGYVVAMNRDELKSRGAATGPTIHRIGDISAIYPKEASGGTWIAASSHGNLLALLNWNLAAAAQVPAQLKSRGAIIPSLLQEETPEKADRTLRNAGLKGTNPFRLVGIFPRDREILEWKWDGDRLNSGWHEWARNHWFSSSRSDVRAENIRRTACEMMWQEGMRSPSDWLRELHASHLPEAGAYSICVHRDDASTVSLTEVQCGALGLRMTYMAGNPCAFEDAPIAVGIPVESVSGSAKPKFEV